MKTYFEQVCEHLCFLQSMGIDVDEIEIGRMTRCNKIGQIKGRGEYAYRCNQNQLRNGCIGIVTWCRGKTGEERIFKTYGLSENSIDIQLHSPPIVKFSTDIGPINDEKARDFWDNSALIGRSPYLERKKVGVYGIRYRCSQLYGESAVVPMVDEQFRLRSCQILNPDGTKRMLAGTQVKGLFHVLKGPIDGQPLGIAESYVTAATCLELVGIPTISSFFSGNMMSVTASMRRLYPKSPIFLFADNDKHLEQEGKPNKGLLTAKKTIGGVGERVYMIEPDFSDLKPCKEVSDWNDLVRVKGTELVRLQMLNAMNNI